MLTQLDGYTYDEAAAIENLSRGTVASRVYRARQILMEQIEPSSRRRSAMSLSEEKKILLSQLVNGELPVDQANQVLGEVFAELAHVLGDAEAGQSTQRDASVATGARSVAATGTPKGDRDAALGASRGQSIALQLAGDEFGGGGHAGRGFGGRRVLTWAAGSASSGRPCQRPDSRS